MPRFCCRPAGSLCMRAAGRAARVHSRGADRRARMQLDEAQAVKDYMRARKRLLVLGYNATLTTAVEAPRQPHHHFDQIQARAQAGSTARPGLASAARSVRPPPGSAAQRARDLVAAVCWLQLPHRSCRHLQLRSQAPSLYEHSAGQAGPGLSLPPACFQLCSAEQPGRHPARPKRVDPTWLSPAGCCCALDADLRSWLQRPCLAPA